MKYATTKSVVIITNYPLITYIGKLARECNASLSTIISILLKAIPREELVNELLLISDCTGSRQYIVQYLDTIEGLGNGEFDEVRDYLGNDYKLRWGTSKKGRRLIIRADKGYNPYERTNHNRHTIEHATPASCV